MIDALEDAGIAPGRSRNVLPHEANWLNQSVITKSGGSVTVDEPGVGGGVIDLLRAGQLDVRGYNGGSSTRQDKYFNLKAESLWGLRTALMESR